jgi:hypothetical protein
MRATAARSSTARIAFQLIGCAQEWAFFGLEGNVTLHESTSRLAEDVEPVRSCSRDLSRRLNARG